MQDDFIEPGEPGDELEVRDRESAVWQSRVLSLLLASDEDGQQLSRQELASELIGENPVWAALDGFERAVGELERHGLVRRVDSLVLLTRPARHFHRLEVE